MTLSFAEYIGHSPLPNIYDTVRWGIRRTQSVEEYMGNGGSL